MTPIFNEVYNCMQNVALFQLFGIVKGVVALKRFLVSLAHEITVIIASERCVISDFTVIQFITVLGA